MSANYYQPLTEDLDPCLQEELYNDSLERGFYRSPNSLFYSDNDLEDIPSCRNPSENNDEDSAGSSLANWQLNKDRLLIEEEIELRDTLDPSYAASSIAFHHLNRSCNDPIFPQTTCLPSEFLSHSGTYNPSNGKFQIKLKSGQYISCNFKPELEVTPLAYAPSIDAHSKDLSNSLALKSVYQVMDSAKRNILNGDTKNANESNELAEDFQDIMDSSLWVDKYAPSKFSDLLSNDKHNLEVLNWFNQWKLLCFQDQKVHKSELQLPIGFKKILLLSGRPGLGKTTLAHMIAKISGFLPVEINSSDERSLGSISGTSGNLKDRVISAITMNSVFGDRKPNCLIMDEIDGAANNGSENSSLIQFLVKLATNNHKQRQKNSVVDVERDEASTEGEEADIKRSFDEYKGFKISSVAKHSNSSKNGKNSLPILRRPIICICNDPWAPVLRPLRQIAQMVHLTPPSVLRLSDRLYDICLLEGLKVDPRALTKLIQLTDGDIRECLHVLQFLKNKRNKGVKRQRLHNHQDHNNDLDLTLTTLQTNEIGLKDQTSAIFSILEEIFLLKSTKTFSYGSTSANLNLSIYENKLSDNGNVTKSIMGPMAFKITKLCDILSRLDTNGIDRIFEGCFENFLSCKFYDYHMKKITYIYDEWIYLKDRLHFSLQKEPNNSFCIWSFLPYTNIIFSVLFAASSNPTNFLIPKQSYLAYLETQDIRNILQTFQQGLILQPNQTDYISCQNIRLDYLWPVLSILGNVEDHLRIIMSQNNHTNAIKNVALLKGPEKELLSLLVDRCIFFNITFQQENVQREDVIPNPVVPHLSITNKNFFRQKKRTGFQAKHPSFKPIGAYQMSLDPPIQRAILITPTTITSQLLDNEMLIKYSNANPQASIISGHSSCYATQLSVNSATVAIRQTILQQIGVQKIKKRKKKCLQLNSTTDESGTIVNPLASPKKSSSELPNRVLLDEDRSLPSTPIKLKKDFFGRLIPLSLEKVPINIKAAASLPNGKSDIHVEDPSRFRLSYRHQESFSNAVRKPIKLGEFLSLF